MEKIFGTAPDAMNDTHRGRSSFSSLPAKEGI
jgi:hypothetical protein